MLVTANAPTPTIVPLIHGAMVAPDTLHTHHGVVVTMTTILSRQRCAVRVAAWPRAEAAGAQEARCGRGAAGAHAPAHVCELWARARAAAMG